ncbi:MAG TPA: chemotaxis protein CheB [Geobacteraceae bacterium]
MEETGQREPQRAAATSDGGTAPCGEGKEPCFIVGIGASAGGLEPLEHIFTAVPTDCGLSFVVVMHIPAEGPSFLADFLRRYTAMEVVTAEEGMLLAANTVYVIPPGREMRIAEGRARLDPLSGTGVIIHPIDRLFTSLAGDMGERVIAVVLSGFGLDGAEGVKRIRENGGVVIIQDPEAAANPPMPSHAIATGAADMVLPAEGIAEKIAEIARGGCNLPRAACLTTTLDEELRALFGIVRARTGHDFSPYKRNTVLRRIERRMTVNQAGGIKKYMAILEENPREAQALCEEILIGVTGFFRDPEAFEILGREVMPRLFVDRDPGDPVRVWHPCCATGEEAYSVAMLICEYLEKTGQSAAVQIFATDIDDAAVARARTGLYPDDIAAEVGEERLGRFFARSNGRWQVAKRLREMILFAHHSIIKDPPFSRLDLLVCRNFFIYLDSDMQKRLISLFHMVLRPGGILFLGAAETVGRDSELFTPLDKKWKIYQRLDSARVKEPFFPFTASIRTVSRSAFPARNADSPEPSPGALAEKLIADRYSPPCVVVNERYEVLHVSPRSRRFLEVPAGEPTTDLMRMAREGLRPTLRAAIYKALAEQGQVAFRGVRVAGDDGEEAVNVLVEPLAADPSHGRLALVILEEAPATEILSPPAGAGPLPGDESSRDTLIRQLEEQLRITHEQLQSAMEQLETSNEGFMSANEELMSINEEFQSANEELQSTNEELETSKEELQALNEELITVNAELQGKVEELNQANGDMENLFASSEIATIFLDRGLIIKRFSPAMTAIFNLIPADVGRPFRHLAGTIDWSGLPNDAQSVLEKLVPVEREVIALEDGRCFIMRVLPYRTVEGKVDGIVVTLVDITERKKAEMKISNLAAIVENAEDAIIGKDLQGIVQSWNMGAESIFGYTAEEMIGRNLSVLVTPGHVDEVPDIIRRIEQGEHIRRFETERLRKDGTIIQVSLTFSPIRDATGTIVGVSKTAHDITERKHAEVALQRAKEEWERTFDSVPDLIAILDDKNRITRINRAMAERLGMSPRACIGETCFHHVHGADHPPDICPHLRTLADGREHAAELHEANLGGDFLVTTTPLLDKEGRMCGSVHVARDITERKKVEDELLRHVEELERFNQASVGRELRMVELKKEVNGLCARLGTPPRYGLEFDE